MKTEIITLLRQRRDYVSGQELCEHFGVSRTAVWKAVEQLKKDGYRIEAVKNRGYLLVEAETPEVFGRTELESRIHTSWAGKNLYYFDSIDSTNLHAKRLAEEGAPHGTLVVADQQTAGRGRRGRTWISPSGSNIYFTLLLRPEIMPDKASMLTLVMAYALAKGIGQVCESPDGKTKPGIKWPNDIVLEGRKACGILTEMSLSVEMDSIQYLVIGVGINAGKQEFAPELQGHAVALEEVYGQVGRSHLLVAVMQAFEEAYGQFMDNQNLSSLQEAYNDLLVNRGRQVRVLDPKGEFEGTALGIKETGELLVELADGSVKEIYAGEVSVRGIYGYV